MYLREMRHTLFYSFKKKSHKNHIVRDSPEAGLSVALFLVDVGRLPTRLDAVAVLPEVDEEVGDLARRRQEALQVERVVAGDAEASRRDDGRAELQTFLHTGSFKRA